MTSLAELSKAHFAPRVELKTVQTGFDIPQAECMLMIQDALRLLGEELPADVQEQIRWARRQLCERGSHVDMIENMLSSGGRQTREQSSFPSVHGCHWVLEDLRDLRLLFTLTYQKVPSLDNPASLDRKYLKDLRFMLKMDPELQSVEAYGTDKFRKLVYDCFRSLLEKGF